MTFQKALWVGSALYRPKHPLSKYQHMPLGFDVLPTAGFSDVVLWGSLTTDPSIDYTQGFTYPSKKTLDSITEYRISVGTDNLITYDTKTESITVWSEMASFKKKLTALLASGSDVQRFHLMIGGGSWTDPSGTTHHNASFPTALELMYPDGTSGAGPKTGQNDIIYKLFHKLREELPLLTGINFDNEYVSDDQAMTPLAQMLQKIGFEVSYIPAWNPAQNYESCFAKVPGTVYPQMYSGGVSVSDYQKKFSVARVMPCVSGVGTTPEVVSGTCKPWVLGQGGVDAVPGMGLWLYDNIVVTAMNEYNDKFTVAQAETLFQNFSKAVEGKL